VVEDARLLSLTDLDMVDFKLDKGVFSCHDTDDGMTLTTTSPDGRNEMLGFRFGNKAPNSCCSSSTVRPNLGFERRSAL